jgi:hypothetical protein
MKLYQMRCKGSLRLWTCGKRKSRFAKRSLLKRRDLTIFDVLIERDEKVCEILGEPTKDIPEGKMLEGSIDTETVKVYNLRSKDTDGNFELLYTNEFTKTIQMTLYTKRKRVKM